MAAKHPKVIDRDLGWAELFKRAKEIRSRRVKVGVIDDGKGAETPGGGLSNAQLAGIHEFGTEDGRIPERSFIRSTFDDKRPELEKLGAELIERVLTGKLTTEQALGLMGSYLAAETKKKITVEGVAPANAPATIAAKGSDRPLVDTGAMVNAITYQVEPPK